MVRVEDFYGHVVGLDTLPFLSYIERNSDYVEILQTFFHAVQQGKIAVVTSMVTLLELLIYPFQLGNVELAYQYRNILLNSTGLKTLPMTQEIAEEAARLRGIYRKIRTSDAIQMATAIRANASFFLTNDVRLPSLPNLRILQLDELKTRQ
jgi:predicted nucleic acid-binding protein